MKNRILRLVPWALVPLFDTGNQIFMKLLGLQIGEVPFGIGWFARALTSPYTLGVAMCDGGSFLAWMFILKRTHISFAVPVSSICYITILFASWFVFHEQIVAQQVLGIGFIVFGLIMIGLEAKPAPAKI